MSARLQPEQQQQRQPGREHEMRPQPDYEPKYPGCGKLKNRVALITGGDSGIGRATAIAMAREGAKIAIVYLEEHEDADETLRLVEREGSRGIKMAGDVGIEDFCAQAVEGTVREFGRLDILVNNAAEQHETKDALELDGKELERTFRTTCSDISSW
jgi:NAD(P)-dependent dehydrogenase (short-subunit alcohol dehydrogenase family)